MKKIGIFLAFAPEQPIRNQGIGRLTAFILSAMLKSGDTTVTIAAPAWYKTIVLDFLAEHRIDASKIEMMTTDRIPLLLHIRRWIKKLVSRRNENKGEKIKHIHRAEHETLKALPASSLLKSTLNNIRSLLFGSLSIFRRNMLIHRLYYRVRKNELSKLIKKINHNKDIAVWFVPTLFWPEIKSIHAKKVVAAPDIVFLEFPLLFASSFFSMVAKQINQTIEVADHLICYSEHVKQKHLMEGFLLDAKQISVVKHGNISLRSFLENADSMKHAACQILNHYQAGFDFANTNYIFYSSQIRPHKNFMSLIKAFEILRNRFVNLKLITTANLMQEKAVWEYIVERQLQFDIVCFSEVSSEVLAALNHLAICAVNPTLFEGGFPFTFTEAYSVGTPSVMSNIAVVLDEVTDPALKEKMLFDPYNLDDMVNKIEWALNHRDELVALQEPLYRKLEARDWEMVANEYIDVFKSVGGQHEVCA